MLADLCAATTVVCYSAYEALLFITAFVLGFFGAFRISEQVPCSKFGCMGICHNQVVLEQSAVHIWLQRSKTDQYGKGAWVTLQVQLDERVCPVSVVRQFLGVRLRAGEHFLIHVNLVYQNISLILFWANALNYWVCRVLVSLPTLFG